MTPAVRAQGPLAAWPAPGGGRTRGLLPAERASRGPCSSSRSSRPTDAVLELGCGSGRLLSAVAARAAAGLRGGHRPLGADGAPRRASATGAGSPLGRAEVARRARAATSSRFADARFDKVYGTHVVYFWTEPERDLAEIRRVLRPGGRLLLGFFPAEPSGSRRDALRRRARPSSSCAEAGFAERRRSTACCGRDARWRGCARRADRPGDRRKEADHADDRTRRFEDATAFAERVLGILNGGALALMISIGHRTGLFDVMSRLGLGDERERSRPRPGSQERYVREWLGAMVTGGVVEYDAALARLSPAAGARRVPHARGAARTTSRPPRSGSRCSARVEDRGARLLRARRRRALLRLSSASTR